MLKNETAGINKLSNPIIYTFFYTVKRGVFASVYRTFIFSASMIRKIVLE